MKKYDVLFYNRFANEEQMFHVVAKNKYRAGRLFYLMHDRKAYHDCIISISNIEHNRYWTEEEIIQRCGKRIK